MYVTKDYKKVDEKMKRKIDREKKLKDNRIVLPGKPVVFSDALREAFRSVPGIDMTQFEFYYVAFRPEEIIVGGVWRAWFDYSGPGREWKEIEMWHEINPKTAILYCHGDGGRYKLTRCGSNFPDPIDGVRKLGFHYDITFEKNEPKPAPAPQDKKAEKIPEKKLGGGK